MSLVFGAICPHPPILIPKIGKSDLNKVRKTIQALLNLEKKLIATKPDIIIILSPHGLLETDKFTILGAKNLFGDFNQFGDWQTKMIFRNDLELSRSIQKESLKNNLPVDVIDVSSLDHGVLVPLFYLTSGKLDNLPIVCMGYSLLSNNIHFKFGQIIKNAIRKNKKRVAFIASGDLSHRLIPSAPAGYSPEGQKFDKKIIDLIEKGKNNEIIGLDRDFTEHAGECGLRSIIVLLGILDKMKNEPEILSYEGPFGVGYLVANFKIK